MHGADCDVLVLGAGPAGASAALSAARAGASVTLVDSRGEVGGNAPFSTGYMAFADVPLQHELGIVDSPEAYVADLLAEVERQRRFSPAFDVELARLYAGGTKEAYAFLDGLGFRFGRLVPRPRQHTIDRMTVVQQPAQFRETFGAELAAAGVDVRLYHAATGLLRPDGRVVGATARTRTGEETTIGARRGVVVALGGYQASEELRARYAPAQDPRAPYPGLDNVRGDGHVMMEAIGAELVNMHMIPQLLRGPSRFIEEVIAVNGHGERFEDEAGPYDERLGRLLEQPEGLGYYLGDAVGLDRVAGWLGELHSPVKRFATLDGVATAIGCDAGVLVRTVQRWNEIVDSGADRYPDFGRVVFPEPRRGITEPPFGVAAIVLGAVANVGGARVTLSMAVLDGQRNPIPGLYAAGDSVGAVSPAGGLGGVHLSCAVTLGLVAGRAAARGVC